VKDTAYGWSRRS